MLKQLCLTLAVLFAGTGAAPAHSFNLLLVVPAEAEIAEDMRLAVLLAADERDWHLFNHSDGHLGGLDVYLTDTRQLADPADWSDAEPDIVLDVLLLPLAHHADGEPDWLALYGTDLDRIDRNATLATAADPEAAGFAERFRDETGREPGEEAKAAYLGARVIDLIVRPLNDGGDPEALRGELEALR